MQPTKVFGKNNNQADSDSDSEPAVEVAAAVDARKGKRVMKLDRGSIKHVTTQPVTTKPVKPRIKSGNPPIRVRMLMKKNPSEVSICTDLCFVSMVIY